MKHILFFIESLSGGGAEKVLVTLLNHLDYSKYKVTLMPLVDTGVLRDDIDMSNLKYTPVIKEAKTKLQVLWNKIKYKLIYYYLPCWIVNRWIIPRNGVDVYIAFTEGFPTKIISHTLQKKIAWVHIDLKSYPWTQNVNIYSNIKEEKDTYRKYNHIVCVSKSVEDVMKDYYGLERTITIYNPIDTEEIINKSQQPISIDIPHSFNMVTVGRLVPQKGFDRLIPIIGRLRYEGHDVHLFIIGEGSDRKSLEKLIHNNCLQDYIHLMGFLKNPYALMKNMDLFVCSSRAEGYSLVIAEALVLGLPVISTDCAGPNELLDNGKYGILVDNNESALYNGICDLINSPEKINILRNKSSQRCKFFNIYNTYKAFEKLID